MISTMHQDALQSSSTATSVSSPSNGADKNSNGGGAFFNPDEVRFMQDSLSSADSFDPFTIGAPGFKVPNVLPANLGGIGRAPRSNSAGGGDASNGSQGWSGREEGLDGGQHLRNLQQQQHTQPHSSSPTPAAIRGGYGRDKGWQIQQLEALQAERQKYMSVQRPQPMPDEQESSSTMPDFTHMVQMGHSLNSIDVELAWLRHEQAQTNNDNHHAQPHYAEHLDYAHPGQDSAQGSAYGFVSQSMQASSAPVPMNASASQDLSHLGLRFPSSHQFPAAPRGDTASSKRQRRVKGEEEGTDEEGDRGEGRRRGRSPSARPPWSQPPNVVGIQPGSINGGGMTLSSSADSLRQGSLARQGSEAGSSQQATPSAPPARNHMAIDLDAPYTFLPAPRPPPKLVDVSKAAARSGALPAHLSDAFFSPGLARFQPHLLLLRREQLKRKERGLSANMRKGDKRTNAKDSEGMPDGVDGEAEKRKAGHVLLTEAEKKANHIASEQKRRANIRKGYELLCDLIPALNENEEAEAEEGIGMEDEGGEEDELKRGKRRRNCETTGGGDRFDGRAGPRSEAAILMAAVEHLRGQLEVHRGLLVRKQEAQLQVAQRYGLDVDASPERK